MHLNALFSDLTPHPQRSAVLGEVHARPFAPVDAPARILRFAFLTDAAQAEAAAAALADFCRARGLRGPEPGARHVRLKLAGQSLRFEQHSEFATYTLELPGEGAPFTPSASELGTLFAGLKPPGLHLAAIDLHLVRGLDEAALPTIFDPVSLAVSSLMEGAALAASDFLPVNGFVRILLVDRGLDPIAAGALATRLLEIETYRLLALLGLPEAQRLAPVVEAAERELASISQAMASGEGGVTEHELLDRLTRLAARSEAETTRAAFRFAASRAYDEIVQQRLSAIGESRVGAWPTFAAFLARRLAPAMRTCHMLQDRQSELANKLVRAANLLRTRVDVEIERQNRDLLRSMDERARLQLRLQETVEGLSVAAISYYVVSLLAYGFKAAQDIGWLPIPAGLATALAVPVCVVTVALVAHRIRTMHLRAGRPTAPDV